jgi:hypothetical protein
VQKIIRRLEVLGVVLLAKRSFGGRLTSRKGVTNMYELHLERLSNATEVGASKAAANDSPANESCKGITPERRSSLSTVVNPEPRSAQPRTAMPINPERRSDEPSIGNLPEEPTSTAAASRPPTPRPACSQPNRTEQVLSSAGWMDARKATVANQTPAAASSPTRPPLTPPTLRVAAGAVQSPLASATPTPRAPLSANSATPAKSPAAAITPVASLRDALASCGVKGHMLESLASSPTLTASAVSQEFESIKADPNTRNAPAVLVARLAKPAGLVRQEPAKALEPNLMAIVAKLEQMRRNRSA